MFFVTAILCCSCARSCQGFERNLLDNRSQNVEVKMYSGGVCVDSFQFHGIINNSTSSDGYYFYVNDKMVEVSGDVVIKYLD